VVADVILIGRTVIFSPGGGAAAARSAAYVLLYLLFVSLYAGIVLTCIRLRSISMLGATQLVWNPPSLYASELIVGYTAACCGDYQSFREQDFPTTQAFERAGPVRPPTIYLMISYVS
jgi:hypothetical protein